MSLLSYIDENRQDQAAQAALQSASYVAVENTHDILQQTTNPTFTPEQWELLDTQPPEALRKLIEGMKDVEIDTTRTTQFEAMLGPDGPNAQFASLNQSLQGNGNFINAYSPLNRSTQDTQEEKKRNAKIAEMLLQQQLAADLDAFFNAPELQELMKNAIKEMLSTNCPEEAAKLLKELEDQTLERMAKDPKFDHYTDEQKKAFIKENMIKLRAKMLEEEHGMSPEEANAQATSEITKLYKLSESDPEAAKRLTTMTDKTLNFMGHISTQITDEQQRIINDAEMFRLDFVAIEAMGKTRLVHKDMENEGAYYVLDDDGNPTYINELKPELRDQAWKDIHIQEGQKFANEDPENAALAETARAKLEEDTTLSEAYKNATDGAYEAFSKEVELTQFDNLFNFDNLFSTDPLTIPSSALDINIFNENLNEPAAKTTNDYNSLSSQLDQSDLLRINTFNGLLGEDTPTLERDFTREAQVEEAAKIAQTLHGEVTTDDIHDMAEYKEIPYKILEDAIAKLEDQNHNGVKITEQPSIETTANANTTASQPAPTDNTQQLASTPIAPSMG